jgi:hypothetical protein
MKYFISIFNFCFSHLNKIIRQIFITIFEIIAHETDLNLIEKRINEFLISKVEYEFNKNNIKINKKYNFI